MLSYSQELRENRERNSAPIDPCYEEYKLLKRTKKPYLYDECYDYATEALPHLIKTYKNWGFDDYELAARNALFEKFNPNISLHKRAYTYWEDMAWEKFKKEWKPKDVDGLNYIWMTLNFHPQVSVPDIILEVSRIINLPIFAQTKISYCYEYYTDKGSHPHVHMLIELKRTGCISFSKINEKIFQKKSLKEVLNLNIKMSWAKEYTDRTQRRAVHQAYLAGNKIEEKQEKCELDKLWRKENNLEELYIKEN